MKERIKDVLVDQMLMIYGMDTEGWWTDPQALNDVSQAVMDVLEE